MKDHGLTTKSKTFTNRINVGFDNFGMFEHKQYIISLQNYWQYFLLYPKNMENFHINVNFYSTSHLQEKDTKRSTQNSVHLCWYFPTWSWATHAVSASSIQSNKYFQPSLTLASIRHKLSKATASQNQWNSNFRKSLDDLLWSKWHKLLTFLPLVLLFIIHHVVCSNSRVSCLDVAVFNHVHSSSTGWSAFPEHLPHFATVICLSYFIIKCKVKYII